MFNERIWEDSSLDAIVNVSSKIKESCISLILLQEKNWILKRDWLTLADKIIGRKTISEIEEIKISQG
jgi:hypothetical protein